MVVASRWFAFRALITQAPILKRFRVQNSTSLLYLPIPSSGETWKILTKKVCQFFFSLKLTFEAGKVRILEALGEFSTVMQTLDFVSGLHNCLEFSQPLSCLYQAMQTRKTFSIA